MNLIILFKEDFVSDNRVRLRGRRFEHITSVLKAQLGTVLSVGLCDGKIGKGNVVFISDVVEMDVSFDQEPPVPLPLRLILGLPRPHLFKRTLFFAAMLGIKDIHILNFNRVEKSLWNSSTLRPENIREHLTLGLEQAKDTQIPTVTLHPQFKLFVEDQLPLLIEGTRAVVAHPDGGEISVSRTVEPISLVIGPEGGIIPYELDMFRCIGFQNFNLGARILRVDACLVFLTARLF